MFSISNNATGSSALASSAPAMPPAAVTHDSTLPSPVSPINPFDGFFGYESSTRNSQHDRRLSSCSSDNDIAPPPYIEPPAYSTRNIEPTTLARFLFKFGFLFPPFWILGALILLSPLRAPEESSSSSSSLPASWLPEKTPAERQHIISQMRAIEVKWAWRCLMALLVLLVAVVAIAVSTWAILKITRGMHSS